MSFRRFLSAATVFAAAISCNAEHIGSLNTGAGKLDLSLAQSVDKSAAFEGSAVTFTLTVTNHGPIAADTVTAGDTLAGLTYVSSTASAGTYTPATGVWAVGSLPVNGTATLNLTANVNAGTGGTTVTNRAGVLGFQTDTVLTNNVAAASVASQSSTPTQLAYTAQPATSTAGSAFGVSVSARNAQGVTVPSYTGNVTLAITPGTGTSGAHLTGSTTVAAVAGVATFAGLGVDSAGTGYTLSATATGLSTGTSNAFAINAGAASTLVFTTQPSTTTPGGTFGVVVTARDALGNKATSFSGNVTVAIGANPGASTLSGTTTVVAVAGVATFTGLSLNNAGTGYTLTAVATGVSTATSAGFNVSTTDEPVDPASNYLWADNFDRYVDKNGTPSVQAMSAENCPAGTPGYQILGPTNPSSFSFFGKLTDPNRNSQDEACNIAATHPEYGITSGRGASGLAIRGNVTGGTGEVAVVWKTPNNPRTLGAYSGTLIMQYWFRLSPGAPAGSIGYKWWMMWYANDPNNGRIQIGIDQAPNAKFHVNSGMPGNQSPFARQYQGPYWDHGTGQVNDGNWHRFTVAYLPNTSYAYPSASSRDGLVQVWLDGTKIIDVSAAGIAAGHCTATDLDKVSNLKVNFVTIIGTLNDPPSNFTIDIDDVKFWTVP